MQVVQRVFFGRDWIRLLFSGVADVLFRILELGVFLEAAA
jgi:hypothetical protein